jgi:hypothetical protein
MLDKEPTEDLRPMDPDWYLARVKEARALHFGEHVSIHIAGELPDQCHVVDIEKNLLATEPPEFIARWYVPEGIRCAAGETSYAYQEIFRVFGEKRERIKLHHAEGVLEIPVEDRAQQPEEHAPPTAVAPHILVPPLLQPSEATGYSRAFDFAEAFQDAISQLPDQGAGIPDWLSTYTVVAIGAEIGGIAGFNHMYVRVRG